MAQGDLFLSTYRYNVRNSPVTITLGFEHTGGVGDIEFELCSIISTTVAAEMSRLQTWCSTDCTFEGCKTRKISGVPQPPGVAKTFAVRGDVAFASVPQSKSLMVVHRQNTQGVRSNGKSFIGGIPESIVVGNEVQNQATLNGIKDIFDDLRLFSGNVTGGSADFRHVVLSKNPTAPGGFVGLPVIANRINSTLYNSRRRQTREFGYAANAQA